MARVTALYLEMLRPTKPGGKKTKRKITAILTGFEPRPFAIPTQTQSQFAFPEISSGQCNDFFRNFRKRRRPRVPFPYHLPPSVFHSNKTSEISKWEQMVRNCLGKFPGNSKTVALPKCGSFNRKFRKFPGRNSRKFVLTMRGSPLFQKFRKMLFHSSTEISRNTIFRQMESDLGFESAPKFSNISS